MKYILFCLILIPTLVTPGLCRAESMINVKLVNYIQSPSELEVKVKGDYFTLDPTLTINEGVNYKVSVEQEQLYLEDVNKKIRLQGNSFLLIPSEYNKNHRIYINGRPYLGAMEFTIENGSTIRPINQVTLEDYLKGVVPHEVYASWHLEALKAQALAARTYAIRHIDNKNFNDTITFQVYGGFEWNYRTTKAVNQTRGEVITHNKRPIDAVYSASNGGMTESNANVWGTKAIDYYPIKKDPYDPKHPWKFSLHQQQLSLNTVNWVHPNWWDQLSERDPELSSSIKNWIRRKGYVGDIKIISIPHFVVSEEKNESKRSTHGSMTIQFFYRMLFGPVLIQQITLDDVPLTHIRPMIGGTTFKSYLIDSLELKDGVYTMKGRGFGHGVGMSQWGASVMGERGKNYREILQFYFPGTAVENIHKK